MAVQTTYNVAPAAAVAGMIADSGMHDIVTMKNKEATQSLPFGFAVCFEGSTDDLGALSPDATTDKIAGITVWHHAYAIGVDGAGDIGLGTGSPATNKEGVLPGGVLSIMRKGRVWVIAEEAVAPGDRLFVRCVATTVEIEGALRKSADSTDCIDSTTQGIWRTTAAAGALAILEVDFTNEP